MTDWVKMEWLVGSDKALSEVGSKATQRNVLVRVLKKAAVPVEQAMEANAPVLTGYTKHSFGISTTLNPANKAAERRQGKGFASVYVGTRRRSAAGLQEFGTREMPAHPFLRPAWDATKDQALSIIAKELWVEIEKAAIRAAKKRGKALL